MKKVFAVCSIVILSLFASGCEKTIELTDEENMLVAEYAAELLMKYDKNLVSKLYKGDGGFVSPHEFDYQTPTDASEEITTEEITTEETTETVTEQTTETTVTTEENVPDMEDIPEEIKADYQYPDFDLAKFVNQENISISYQYSQLTDIYPAYDNSGMYIEVEAPDGYKLLVLKFRLENLTNESQMVDLYSKDISYRIIINNQKSAKQMFTILMDDLYTYKSTIGGSSIDDVVLLFQVSDSVAEDIEDMKLKVIYSDKNAIIQLK